ncbi:MAG TPA: tetratricopeptide repeat protein [Ktedonobacteraceae bacterium]|nr:tetratricopeptide repeat protein [Ktedonobacteraceae bacterium]
MPEKRFPLRLLRTCLFRFLAVFIGGCTLQALETTWELAGYAQEKEPVLDRVASLLDKSMLSCSIEQMGESRLFLLRTLRDYGLHCLALAGELEPFQRVHATYYLALAEEAEPQLKGSQPRQWLELLQREHENLREAFSYFITLGEREKERGTEMALRMGNALERFWVIGGHVKEGRNLLERALKRDWEVPGPLRGRALCLLSTLARYQADYPAAIEACQASLALFREMDDTAGIVNTLCRLGYVIWMQGDFCKAREYYEESLVLSQGGQCQEARSEALYYFASMTFFQGDMSLAHRLIEESLDLCRELGDKYTMALALNMRGLVALFERDVRAAQTFQQESLTLSRELGNQRAMAFALAGLGEVAFLMDDFPRACACYEESLSISLQLNGLWIPAISLTRLARVAIAMGDAIWAVRLFSAAETLRQALGVLKTIPLEKEEYAQAISTLHGLLDEPSFATAWAEGKKMSLEQAVAARGREEQAASSSSLLKAKPIARRVSLPRSLHDDLTQREKEVLRLVAQGLTNAQVAADLVMSDRTVNFHLTSIYRKLQVSSRSGATRYVLEYHLFEE